MQQLGQRWRYRAAELPVIRGLALCVNPGRCQSSSLPPPPDQNGRVLVQWRKKTGRKQGTRGCWHVLCALGGGGGAPYVISLPIWIALIFDEGLAQHSPLSPNHLILSLPLFSLCSLLYRFLFFLPHLLPCSSELLVPPYRWYAGRGGEGPWINVNFPFFFCF